MQIQAVNPEDYLSQLSEERRISLEKLRRVILEKLPEGFSETINYGMIGYVVPLSIYPAGYHCDNSKPLPFINLASQKNFIAMYHMGLYASAPLLDWFTLEYTRRVGKKPDMGKSCIRFKKPEEIPFTLIGELVAKIKPEDWIAMYESQLKR